MRFQRRRLAGMLILGLVAVAAFFGPDVFVEWCLGRAQQSLGQRQWSRAEGWLRTSETFRSSGGRKAFLRARLARKRGRVEEMGPVLQVAQQKGYSAELIRREVWLADAQSGRVDELERHLANLFSHADDETAEVCEAYVYGCLLNYRFDPALTVLDLWRKDFPRDPQPCVLTGRIAEYHQNLDNAEAQYRAALQIDSRHASAAYNLGRLLLTRQKPAEALDEFRRCALNLEEAQPAIVGQAQCLRLLNRPAEARRQLELAVTASGPAVEEAYRLVGEPTESAGSRAFAELGQLELAEQQYGAAVEWFQQALAANPQDWKTQFGFATALQRTGRVKEAAVAFERVKSTKAALAETDRLFDVLKSNPDDADARCAVGRVFLEHLSEKQGLVWLNSALGCDPTHQKAHRLLAEYFSKKSHSSPRFAELAEHHRRYLQPERTNP